MLVPTTLKVREMFKLLEMIGLCILFNVSLPFFPNNWVRDPSIELDHPPKTYIMMLYCVVLLYPLNCSLRSQRRGPYFNTFSSSFFSRFWIQGELISRVVTVFAWWSTILVSTLLVLTSLYSGDWCWSLPWRTCFNRSVKTAPPPWSRIWPFLTK